MRLLKNLIRLYKLILATPQQGTFWTRKFFYLLLFSPSRPPPSLSLSLSLSLLLILVFVYIRRVPAQTEFTPPSMKLNSVKKSCVALALALTLTQLKSRTKVSLPSTSGLFSRRPPGRVHPLQFGHSFALSSGVYRSENE
jgi:hypothetical protein